MDIGPAQELLDRVGKLDYIDLIGTAPPPRGPATPAGRLPPGVEVVRPGSQGRRTEGLVASYRLNLAVLSAIALFVGMFLIYQSVTLSVVRRRREIGLLRTLGMTPGQVLLLFLAEGAGQRPGGRSPGTGPGGGPGPGRPGGDDPEPHLPLHAGGGHRGWGPGRPPAPGLGPGGGAPPSRRPWCPPGRRPAPSCGPCGTGRNWRRNWRARAGLMLRVGSGWPWSLAGVGAHACR